MVIADPNDMVIKRQVRRGGWLLWEWRVEQIRPNRSYTVARGNVPFKWLAILITRHYRESPWKDWTDV